jgi:hypothetical protein
VGFGKIQFSFARNKLARCTVNHFSMNVLGEWDFKIVISNCRTGEYSGKYHTLEGAALRKNTFKVFVLLFKYCRVV